MDRSDENKSGSSGSDSEETTQRRNQEIAEGKRPLKLKRKKKGTIGLKLGINCITDIILDLSHNKGVVIGKSQTEAVVKHKASENTATVEPKAKRDSIRRSKGMVAETNAEGKRKRREEETDDLEGGVTDSEEMCKKNKKEPNNDNDDGTDDDDGTVGGAHTNVPSVDLQIAAGN